MKRTLPRLMEWDHTQETAMAISENRFFSCRGKPTEKSGTAYKEALT
jgi:hypothetical protein